MHVAIVANNFPVVSETFILQHAIGLLNRGYEVTVFSRAPSNAIAESALLEFDQKNGKRIILPESGASRPEKARQLFCSILKSPSSLPALLNRAPWDASELLFAHHLKKALEKTSPDILHLHFGINAATLNHFRPLDEDSIVTWHGYDANVLPRSRSESMYHPLFASPARHTVGSIFMDKRLSDLGAKSCSVTNIPMGVNIESFQFTDRRKEERQGNPFKIISVGRLEEMKGHRYLIDAASELLSSGANLEVSIIGDGPLFVEFEATIKSRGLGENIKLLGSCPPEKVRSELAKSDLFALTGVEEESGRIETQGVAIIEAQASGLPVIVGDVGGASDSLIDGITGKLVCSKDLESISRAITYYMGNDEERFISGEKARQLVEEKFTLARMLDSFETMYQSMRRAYSH